MVMVNNTKNVAANLTDQLQALTLDRAVVAVPAEPSILMILLILVLVFGKVATVILKARSKQSSERQLVSSKQLQQ